MRSKVLLATGAGNGSLMAFFLPETAGLMKEELLTQLRWRCSIALALLLVVGSPHSDLKPLKTSLAALSAGPMIAHDDKSASNLAFARDFVPLTLFGLITLQR